MSRRKTNEEFLAELAAVNPNIEPLEPYVSAVTKMDCRCKVCGYVWKAKPHNLLGGHGCPKCAAVSKSLKMRERMNAEKGSQGA